jgi:GntR family transcriptional regulator, histidine utilization repressor
MTAPTPPLYLEIRRAIEARIVSGEWRPGHRLPAETELARRHGCSRMTVNKALSHLAAAGLVLRRRRYGSVVAAPHSQEPALKIPDIPAEIAEAGKRYRYRILERQVRRGRADDRTRLGLRAPARILTFRAIHYADDMPFVLEERLINLAAVPGAASERFEDVPPGTWLLRRIPWSEAEHRITAIAADQGLAKLLALGRERACLVVERHTWQRGVPITFVRLYYPGERHTLVARFSPGV